MFFSKTKQETLVVQGMTCSHCEQTGDPLVQEAIRKRIVDLGYQVAGPKISPC